MGEVGNGRTESRDADIFVYRFSPCGNGGGGIMMGTIERCLISLVIIVVASVLRAIVYSMFGITSREEPDFHFRLIIAVIALGRIIRG